MRAHFPRCYVDVNREPYELDPRMFEGRLPSFANTRSMRVAGGLGTVARVVGDAQEIYDRRISVNDALRRIESLYKPYHRALRRLFTKCIAISARRSWSIATPCRRPPGPAGMSGRAPTWCWATATAPVACRRFRKPSRARCARFGYAVSRNKPYAGGFITEHYGNPAAGLHTIQLEINRGLYMDERRFERSADFSRLASHLQALADRLAAIPIEECGRTAPRPNSSAEKERGRRTCRRPKSREETPKEGGGRAIRRTAYRAAQICHRNAQSTSDTDLICLQKKHGCS